MVKRPREEDDVSLFPFLSILACVIGTLTLMIAALALGEINEDRDELLIAENFEKTKQDRAVRLGEIEQLKKKIDAEQSKLKNQSNAQQLQLAEARRKVQQLQQQIDNAKKAVADASGTIEIPTFDAGQVETIDQLKEQLTKLNEQIAQLEKEIADRKLPPIESEVTILPSGSGLGFKPIFVECAADSIVIHAPPKPQRIRRADVASNKTFIDMLTQIVNSPDKSMVFLVRDDGLSTWHTARNLANNAEARNGKLPVIGKGRIDLSYFGKK